MFNQKNQSQINQEIDNELPKLEPEIFKDAKIHSMPEKFLKHLPYVKVKKSGQAVVPGQKVKTSGIKKSILIGSLIGLLFIIVIGAAAWMFIRSIQQQPEDTALLSPSNGAQPQDIGEPEPALPGEKVCGQDNCGACDVEQCRLLAEFCHLEEDYEPCGYDPNQECLIQECDEGPEEIEDEFEQEEEEEEQKEEEDKDLEVVGEFSLSLDTDKDGLTDIEEKIWGTDVNNPDTDGDSYLDGLEIKNLYHPLSGGSKTLTGSNLVNGYIQEDRGYSFYYPAGFDFVDLDEDGTNLTITSTSSNEFFNLLILSNETNFENIDDWYLAQNPFADDDDLKHIDLGGYKAVVTDNGLNVYALVSDADDVYLISYHPGLSDKLNLMTTFQMILKSFEFFENPF